VPRVQTLAEFLGPAAWTVLAKVTDRGLSERATAAIDCCRTALAEIDAVNLAEQELADLETPNVAAWSALAPGVRNVLLAVRQASDRLQTLFPPPPPSTGDIGADELAEIFGKITTRETKVDDIVRGSTSNDALGENIGVLATVLQNDIIGLGGKLRNPQVVGDRWFLLGELHQFLSQCGQCLEAIIATILGALTTENLDDVLPRYVDATARAIKLRAAMVDLSVDVDRYNAAISRASILETSILKTGLTERIHELSSSPVYKFLKPQDKQAIILFRIFLNSWEKSGRDEVKLRQELEGFSKFLHLVRDLNWRDMLAENDRRALISAHEFLESGVDVLMIKPYLERAYGRSPELDELVRAMRSGIEPDRDALMRAVHQSLFQFGV
jgi:hypothetical protein